MLLNSDHQDVVEMFAVQKELSLEWRVLKMCNQLCLGDQLETT